MRTIKGRWGTIFHHNSDFSGNVVVVKGDGTEFEIPAQDILDLVAEHVRSIKIAKLEDLLPEQLLGLRK